MNRFGESVREARTASQRTQAQLADALNAFAQPGERDKRHQPWIARLEAGGVRDVEPIELEALSAVLGISYDSLALALFSDKYGQNNRSLPFMAFNRTLPLSKVRERLCSEALTEVWIASSADSYGLLPELSEAAAAVIARGCPIFHIVGATWEGTHRRCRDRIGDILDRTLDESEFRVISIPQPHSALLAAPFIIAEEKSSRPWGYQFLMDEEEKPLAAIELPERQVAHCHMGLLSFVF